VKEEKENIKEEEHHKVVVICCLHLMDNQWGKEVVCIEKYRGISRVLQAVLHSSVSFRPVALTTRG
jgi:hypothetical protein